MTEVMEPPTQTETLEAPEVPLPAQRPSGINIGGNTVTQATAHLPEAQRTLLRAIHTIARADNWDWSTLEHQTGISHTTWWRIWTDNYRYQKFEVKEVGGQKVKTPHPKASERIPLDSICEKIARWKKLFDERAALPTEEFVETSVWERIEWNCRRAFLRKKVAFIYGDSQMGKTTGLIEYQRRNNSGQTIYLELPPAAGVQLMTRTIARALNVASETSFEKLLLDVADALDESKLLIIDEVHRVFTTYQKTSVMRCLDVLRWLHDQRHCGLVLCGTNVGFRDKLKEGDFAKYLQQLRRRGLYELQLLPVPPREDLDKIAARYGLSRATGEAEEVMLHIAKEDGLGKFCIRLMDAVELAKKKKDKLDWAHFIKAHNIAEKMARLQEPKK